MIGALLIADSVGGGGGTLGIMGGEFNDAVIAILSPEKVDDALGSNSFRC